ncbi:MAG: hypothetical protein RLZZ29_1759 [Cyanobacteriota bacterium]|jgi:hypothetical protein
MFYHRPVNLHVHINLQLTKVEGQPDLTHNQDSSINNVPKTVKLGTKLEWFGQIKQSFYPSVHGCTGENENTKINSLSYC